MRLKDVAFVNLRTLDESTKGDYKFRYIDISSVFADNGITLGDEITFQEAPSRARRIVKKDDVLVSTVRTYLRAIANIDWDAKDIIASTGFAVYTPNNKIIPRFLAYSIKSTKAINQICSNSKGVSYPAIQAQVLSSIEIPYWDLKRQEAIAAYLDKECEKIGRKIELLERKADAYSRLRRSLINRAVTRGLDPNTPMKSTLIPWLGAIPVHWNIKRGKSLFKEVSRAVRPEDGVVTCFRNGEVTLRTNRRITGFTESEQEIGYHGVRIGDLVIHQMDAFAGAIGISDSDGKCSPICIVCREINSSETDLKYYCQLLRVMSHRGYIQALAKGIRERTTDFRYKTLASLHFPVPPIDEQKEIAAYLDEKCAKIDAILEKINTEVERLKELKRSLINEVVTGQRAIDTESRS